MASIRSVSVLAAFALSLGLVACGSGDDDDGGGGTAIDAAPTGNIDASMPVDAAGGGSLMGLGQPCVPSMMGADCPANANGCLSTQGATTGFCTKLCVQSATFRTDAMGQIPQTGMGAITPNPSTQDSMCTGIYTGTVGAAVCSVPVNLMPAPPLQPNTNYTVAFACGIRCGANNACPSGLTCNTQVMECRP